MMLFKICLGLKKHITCLTRGKGFKINFFPLDLSLCLRFEGSDSYLSESLFQSEFFCGFGLLKWSPVLFCVLSSFS